MNRKHYGLLKRGVRTWNAWRKEHRDVQPDLSFADLSDANLYNADLSRTNVSRADLSLTNLNDANLSGADLRGANLSGADLIGADLRRAYFTGANLNDADLSGAILSDTNISRVDLSGAILRDTDFSCAYLWHTTFANNDLNTAKGLLEIHHAGPSSIRLHSVKLPQDGSALHFLRGAGVPDEWIDFYRTTTMNPIQYSSCFISYSNADEVLAHRLHADLQDEGVRCWFAPHDLRPGQLIQRVIDQAIHMQDKVLLILSKDSTKSNWVEYEVRKALTREIHQKREILFPIRIDDAIFECSTSWARELREERHIGDFREWADPTQYQMVFKRLLRDLKAHHNEGEASTDGTR